MFPRGFLIYINSLVDHIQNRHPSVQCFLFADDFAIYFSAINLDVAIQKVQYVINLASHWGSILGFKFSTSRTVRLFPRLNVSQNKTKNDQIKIKNDSVYICTYYYKHLDLCKKLFYLPFPRPFSLSKKDKFLLINIYFSNIDHQGNYFVAKSYIDTKTYGKSFFVPFYPNNFYKIM